MYMCGLDGSIRSIVDPSQLEVGPLKDGARLWIEESNETHCPAGLINQCTSINATPSGWAFAVWWGWGVTSSMTLLRPSGLVSASLALTRGSRSIGTKSALFDLMNAKAQRILGHTVALSCWIRSNL